MMDNWVKKRDDFEYVICLDVSRWGRFQDIDLSAQYSAECKRNGKEVIYTKIGMPKEDDPLYPVYVQFERFRAAQYSKELSDKVFRGCVKIAEQGYWPGGKPRYGLARLLLDEARAPVQVLKPGERKSIQNQRVSLAPGDEQEVSVVLRIFHEFVEASRHEYEIAKGLNTDGHPSPGGSTWDADKVLRILKDELYVGTMIYNRTTQKLSTPSRSNPLEQWVKSPNAFERLVEPTIFERAQQVLAERAHRTTPEYMLQQLQSLFELHGIVRESLILRDADTPSPSTYSKHFGSLNLAYQGLFAEVHQQVHAKVVQLIEGLGVKVEPYEDFLVIEQKLTVIVQPSVPMPYGYGAYWYFRPDQRDVIDITLGVPLSNGTQPNILGYLALPRLLVRDRWIRLFSTSESRITMFGQNGLEIIRQLVT